MKTSSVGRAFLTKKLKVVDQSGSRDRLFWVRINNYPKPFSHALTERHRVRA